MNKKSMFVFFVVMLAIGLITAVVAAAPAGKDNNPVFWWWGAEAGTSQIVRTDNGISGNFSSSLANEMGDMQGQAVTLWLVVFNDPTACAEYPDPCIEDDLFNEAVMADVLYAGGNIIGASEMASFGFHRNEGDNSGSIADLFGMPLNDDGEGFGLLDPRGAEIHYVARIHGPKNTAEMPAMIQSYGGGCVFGAPYGYPVPAGPLDLHIGDGDCQDVQFAINSP